MTASSTSRKGRRATAAARERQHIVVTMAVQLAAMADLDPTISGATIISPDGECRYLGVDEAKAIAGIGPAAGSA